MGIGLGAFIQGATDGYDKARQRDIQDEQAQWAREDHAEIKNLRDSKKKWGEEMEAERLAHANGRTPGQELTPEAQAVSDKADASYDRTENARFRGIATPDTDATAAPAAPADDKSLSMTPEDRHIFNDAGEGKYKNQAAANNAHWDRLKEITAQHYARTGQTDQMMQLDKQIDDWKESAYNPLRKAAAAAVATGHPDAINQVNKFAQAAGLGFSYSGGSFDKATNTYTGVEVTGPDGKTVKENLPAQTIYSTLSALTPEKRLEMGISQLERDRDYKVKQQTADAATLHAKNTGVSAQATVDLRNIALQNQKENKDREYKATQDAKFNSQLETEMYRGKDPNMLSEKQKEDITATKAVASGLRDIPGNEKLNAATLGGVTHAIKTGSAVINQLPSTAPKEQRDNFLQATYAGQTVLIPRSLVNIH